MCTAAGTTPIDLLGGLLADLEAERTHLRSAVEGASVQEWSRPTRAPGWTVRDQIAHLAFSDDAAALSIADPERFDVERTAALADPEAYGREHLQRVPREVDALLAHWTAAAETFRAAVRAAAPGVRAAWFGPPMSLANMVTARLMETWAHGFDVVEGLGVQREPTDRLRHVASLAVRARAYGYIVRGLEPSTVPVRVELAAPSGATWAFGPEEATETVLGAAEDFCLVLTRRRHVDDSGLVATGSAARQWLEIGQAFAGPPGEGPARA